MSASKYQKPRGRRFETIGNTGRTRGGRLEPVSIVPFLGSEGGMIRQELSFELDAIPGRLLTPIRAEVTSVYVPLQALHELKYPDAALPGNDELIRQELLTGDAMFGVELESKISKRAKIEPRSVSGQKYVSEMPRLAYVCAVNHLRQKKYVKAALLTSARDTIAPAILSRTVLDLLNGVLDPEDRVNGAVNLSGRIPIDGLGIVPQQQSTNPTLAKTIEDTHGGGANSDHDNTYTSENHELVMAAQQNDLGDWYPAVYADFGKSPADITTQDFYEAERMDALTREMRKLIDANPVHGEQQASRWAHGLSMQMGKEPFVMYQDEVVFGDSTIRAMDGANLDKLQTNSTASWPITIPVPKTEFGGMVVTLVAIKPDEVLANQPHPILSREWKAINFVADEMALDPVPVRMRDIDSECQASEEENVMMHIGNNHLLKSYLTYGFNREINPTTVEAKSAIWQLEIPTSVTPETVNYPYALPHYPFADQTAEVCTYQVDTVATIVTPIIFGPTPVEELAVIEDADLFEDSET